MQALIDLIRNYVIRRIAETIDKDGLIAEASEKAAQKIVQDGLTPDDEALIDETLGIPPAN